MTGRAPIFPAQSHADCDLPAAVTAPGPVTAAASQPASLVLALFPGIDLFGRGFEAEGFCVVRGPDVLWGGDIRRFAPPAGRFNGIIGGSPCQDFSRARRSPPTGAGLAMLAEFVRIVELARPDWFLLENVPCVPTVTVRGYRMQRVDLDARECGLRQRRLRHFQFGSDAGLVITLPRSKRDCPGEPACLASEGRRQNRRTWAEFCELQGLPMDFDLPGMTKAARYAAVGNGVPVPMARMLARAILTARPWHTTRLCACGCGRELTPRQIAATAACRKRLERRRRERAGINGGRRVTVTNLALPSLDESQ